MVFSTRYFILFIIFTCIAVSACVNEYERQAIGYYEVDKFESLDSTQKTDLPTLLLKEDKTFVLTFKDKKITGKWEADNYGDFTVADFTFDNRHAQGELLGQRFERIEIINPLDFYINAKLLSFKRVEKR